MSSTAALHKILSPFWLVVAAFVLSVGWLLPNHYPPWSSFHLDAWVAAVLLVVAVAIIVRSPKATVWHGMSVLAAALVCIPWVQYGFGLIPLAGITWITSIYLLGLLLALLVGVRWESTSPGQLADCLFLAIGFAALVSVGLQLHQWLMLDGLDLWSMGHGDGRPYANFGQPNQLGTLLLWSLLGIAWAVKRRQIGAGTAVFCAIYLLFGLALTASRTAWVAILLITTACWMWRSLWSNRWVPWTVTGLAVVFICYILSIGWLSEALMIASSEPQSIARVGTETRPMIWAMFGDAALRHPVVGYGWNPLSVAQIEVAADHPEMNTVYSHSHNLFLDLMLWCGIPIGLAVSLYLLRWLWTRIKRVSCAEDALMVLFIVVALNHAMLEFPLQYAYFLLPVGLVMGALDSRLGSRAVGVSGRRVIVVLWLLSVVLLALLIRDYSRIESTYQALRFEWAGYKSKTPVRPPDVLLLSQWRSFVWYVRLEPLANVSAADIELMRILTRLYPSSGFFHKLATVLALNNQPYEAQWWLRRICKISSAQQCISVKELWAKQSLSDAKIALVAWPD